MRGARSSLMIATLAACATAIPSGLPSRAAVAAAALQWEAAQCVPDETRACDPSPRRIEIRALRCEPTVEPEYPGRVLCIFSGERVMSSGVRLPFALDCAYFRREAAGDWRILAIPDADLCGTQTADDS